MVAIKMSRGCLPIALIGALAVFSLPAWAGSPPPDRINFQGMARDSAGNLLSGPVAMAFRFYDDPSAGNLLWEEVYDPIVYPPAVTFSAGLFTLSLGDPAHRNGGSEPFFQALFANHGAIFLGLQAGADAEMTPRIPVTAAPFSLNAGSLNGRSDDEFANFTHGHSAADIYTGTLPSQFGGTGLSDPGASGNVLTSQGSFWVSAPPSAAASGAVVDTADVTLSRSGAGSAADPYKLSLNLDSSNDWTSQQIFSQGASFPGNGIWTS
jgi:hypothetical protein